MDNSLYTNQRFEKMAARRTGGNIAAGVLVMPIISLFAQFIALSIPGFMGLYQTDSVVQIIYSAVVTMIGFFGGGALIIALESRKPSFAVPNQKISAKEFLMLFFIGVGFCSLSNILSAIMDSFLRDTLVEPKNFEFSIPSGICGQAIYIICGAVFPALAEEFLYRGVVFSAAKKFSKNVAIVVSAVLFSLMHGNLVQIPFAFLVGLYLGFVVAKTGNIFLAIAIHFTNNFIAYMLSILAANYGYNILGLVNLCYIILSIAIGLLCLAFYYKNINFAQFNNTPHTLTQKSRIAAILFNPIMFLFYAYVVYSIIKMQILY